MAELFVLLGEGLGAEAAIGAGAFEAGLGAEAALGGAAAFEGLGEGLVGAGLGEAGFAEGLAGFEGLAEAGVGGAEAGLFGAEFAGEAFGLEAGEAVSGLGADVAAGPGAATTTPAGQIAASGGFAAPLDVVPGIQVEGLGDLGEIAAGGAEGGPGGFAELNPASSGFSPSGQFQTGPFGPTDVNMIQEGGFGPGTRFTPDPFVTDTFSGEPGIANQFSAGVGASDPAATLDLPNLSAQYQTPDVVSTGGGAGYAPGEVQINNPAFQFDQSGGISQFAPGVTDIPRQLPAFDFGAPSNLADLAPSQSAINSEFLDRLLPDIAAQEAAAGQPGVMADVGGGGLTESGLANEAWNNMWSAEGGIAGVEAPWSQLEVDAWTGAGSGQGAASEGFGPPAGGAVSPAGSAAIGPWTTETFPEGVGAVDPAARAQQLLGGMNLGVGDTTGDAGFLTSVGKTGAPAAAGGFFGGPSIVPSTVGGIPTGMLFPAAFLGATLARGPARIPSQSREAQALAGTESQFAQTQLAEAQAGRVTPGAAAAIAQFRQQAEAQLYQRLAAQGIDPRSSTAFQQGMAQIEQQAQVMTQTFINQMFQQALSAGGQASQTLLSVSQQTLAQEAAFNTAVGQALLALGFLAGGAAKARPSLAA